MARVNENELFVHIQLELSVSESTTYWYDPRANKTISLDIPVDMFSGEALAKKVDKIMKDLEKAYPIAKAEYEQRMAQEEAEKAAKEAVKVNT
jgi:hypothetical protein